MKKLARAIGICMFYASASISLCFTQRFLTSILAAEQFANLLISTIILYYTERNNKNQLVHNKQAYRTKFVKICQSIKNKFWETLFEAKQTWILSALYILNAFCGLKGIEYVSIPMYLALRRTLVFFVLIVTTIIGSSKIQNYSIIFAIFLITVGAIVAAVKQIQYNFTIMQFNDLDASYIGYTYIITHNILTAFMLEYCNILSERRNVGLMKIIQNNATNTLPILIIFCYFVGDFSKLTEFEQPHMNEFYFCFAVVAILSFIHQYAQFYCSKENSSFAIGLTNNYKDIFSTSFGILIFQDLKLNKFIIFGFCLSFLGAFLYTYSKIFEINPVKQKIQEQELDEEQRQYIIYNYEHLDLELEKMA